MKQILGYPVCKGCKHSSLHFCNKFNKTCLSVSLNANRTNLPCTDCLENDSYEEGLPEIKTKDFNKKIGYFHMPGFADFRNFVSLLKFKEYYPEAFYENREISEFYGAFTGCIWNGRSPNLYQEGPVTLEEIVEFRNQIEELGLSVNLTWNNHLISGTDVYDRYCNKITEIFHNGKHSITVASLELFNYLKENYPNYKYYQSVIVTSHDTEGLVKKDENFDMYLWTRNLNNNWDELLKVPEEERSKIEFLCTDTCTPICDRMVHYNLVNSCLRDRRDESFYIGDYCTIDHDFIRFNANNWPVNISTEQIDKYIENGFIHFKLCSRGDITPILFMKVIPYLVKPEYIEDAMVWSLHGFTKPRYE